MGCLNHRRKNIDVRADQKWDYINLRDFHSKGCFPAFAYAYLWLSLLISSAVYGVDTFTAVNLLAFNKWSSEIQPAISFSVSKWIFSVCIIASFINLGFEHIRAQRVMKRGNVAECYLDNLAVRLESIRLGKGQGWRRFLVFAELTKSKKGAEYIALFTYFGFQSWLRVILCSGPRQVVNALTLRGVYTANLADTSAGSFEGTILALFQNIRLLAQRDSQQALILSGMLFTLVIWVFSALFLLAAVFFYVVFLWHWIPKADGGLSGYCERKVNKALMKIVAKKVNKAIAKEEANRMKAELKAAKRNGEKQPFERTATLPTLPSLEGGDDKLPQMPMINRNDTMTTLPAYTSRPGTPGSIELSAMDQKRPMPARSGTMSSAASYSSRAPLLGSASEMGFNGPQSPAPSVPSVDFSNYPPVRPGTASSQRSFAQRPPQLNRVPTHATSGSGSSFSTPFADNGSNYGAEMPFPPPVRSPTNRTVDSYGRPPMTYSDGRSSPALSTYSSPRGPPPMPRNPNLGSPGYQPMRSATNPVPPRGSPQYLPQYPPQRNMTAPVPPRQGEDYFNRPGTAGSQRSMPRGPGYNYNYDVESQRDRRY